LHRNIGFRCIDTPTLLSRIKMIVFCRSIRVVGREIPVDTPRRYVSPNTPSRSELVDTSATPLMGRE